MRGLSGFTDNIRDGSKGGFDPRHRHFHFAPKADIRQRGSHVRKAPKPKPQFNQSVRCEDKLAKRANLPLRHR
jgi:diadenosine tetraphosphate (Ap4A) HIT family hydrolase